MARKKTHEEFVLQVNEIFNNEIEVLGTFIKTSERVLVKCKKCNHEWNPIANSLLQKHGCFECARKAKTKTNEQFLNEVYELVQNEYTVLEKYKTTHEKILIRHNCEKCNNFEYPVAPHDFLIGTRCPKCEGSMKKTHDEFIEELYNLFQDEYIVLEKYINTNTKLLTRHNCKECNNHEWMISPSDLLSGVQCPICQHRKQGEARIRSQETFESQVYDVFGDKYIVKGIFKGIDIPVEVYCITCNKHWSPIPYHLLNGHGCPHCAGNALKTTEEFIEQVKNKHNNRYTVIGEYINAKTKIEILCNICNETWSIFPNNLIRDYGGCPNCNLNRAELAIKECLTQKQINFKPQYKFNDCRNIKPLPFDSAILDEYNNVIGLIEADGQQHFEPVRFGGISQEKAEKNFIETQKRDKIKTDYCLTHKIPLLRIPYWEFDNIESIINNFIQELSPQQDNSILLPNNQS